MLRGFATSSFYADDLEAAERWYADLLGVEAYYHVPGYTEFRVGDYQHELGIIDAAYKPPAAASGPGGAVIFWHVDDVTVAYEKLLGLGATKYEDIVHRPSGFITASVVDPFGNILGVMYNPHYVEVLEDRMK